MESLSVHDDFFEVGGDSLLSIRILAKLSGDGLRLSAEDFFAHPTIAAQARLVSADRTPAAAPETHSGDVPLTPIQRWFVERIHGERRQWNMCRQYRLAIPVDTDTIQAAFTEFCDRHAAMRLEFDDDAGLLRQTLREAQPVVPLVTVNVEQQGSAELERAIEGAAARLHADMTIGRAPLLRVAHIRNLVDGDDRLLVCVHHLVMDAISLAVLEEELTLLLASAVEGKRASLPATSTPFPAWSRRLAGPLESLIDDAAGAYWRQAVAHAEPRIPVDFPTGSNTEGDAAVHAVRLPPARTRQLFDDVPAGLSNPGT